MDSKSQIKKLRILLLSVFGAGFAGTLSSLTVLAVVGGDEPSVVQMSVCLPIAGIFFLVMLSSLFFLIPFRKAVFSGNDKILTEYGTAQSRTKEYELYYTGFEIQTDNGVCINSKIANGFLSRTRISKLFFAPAGFCTDVSTSFGWEEVIRIKINAETKQIEVLLRNNQSIFLPYQRSILYLIKTFCPREIENETAVLPVEEI